MSLCSKTKVDFEVFPSTKQTGIEQLRGILRSAKLDRRWCSSLGGKCGRGEWNDGGCGRAMRSVDCVGRLVESMKLKTGSAREERCI